ncbi:hypothetical protein [Dongia sedimenti]|uniref:Uncharacterized protein n=1 Tax=Dongia sedimenti TaxID=3064282 RepID=A0ABU0YQL4_9PROT|nr:hypothetical protein [Rhodospirillaceae bacterium R-7]
MTKASVKGWMGSGAAALLLSLALLHAVPAGAQETPEQFDAANAENRRHSEAQNQLRNQAHDLRTDRGNALLQCQGAGSAAAQGACSSNVEINTRQRDLDLNNQFIRERNSHNQILKGIGVHRVP